MGPPWAHAFPAALAATVVGTPLLRRLALATGLVDHPDARKSHGGPVPYLGGVAIMAGVLVALAFLPGLGSRAAILVLAGAALGAIGLLDDDRTVPPQVRFLAEVAAAALAVAVGLRIHATGIEGVDLVLTVVWIVGITNALNLLDNMDGLAAGVAGTAAVAVFFLAMLNGQHVAATLSAGVAGACGGFLVFNRQPASIFMGDAGSLFLGFVLAVLTIDVSPGLGPPDSFAVPVILLGLAVLDTSTVTLARLRRGKRVSEGGKDHLSHRLVALGLSPRAAVDVLIAVQAALTVLSVLAGRQVIPLAPASVGAGVVLVVLSVITSRARVYDEQIAGLPSFLLIVLWGAAAAVVLMASPAVLAMARADGLSRQAANAVTGALHRVGEADPGQTRAELDRASALFHRARGRLNGPFVSLGLAIPGVSPNLRAARSLATSGADVADAGDRIAAIGEAGQARVAAGSVGSDNLAGVAPALDAAGQALSRARDRLVSADRPYLLPGLRRQVRDLGAKTATDARLADRVAQAARLLPRILGTGDTRRYLLVFENGGQLPGAGGHIAASGYLVAENGHVRLETTDLPQALDEAADQTDAISSPDFPTAARALSNRFGRSGERPPDGVVAVDTPGLAALVGLVGPTDITGWPRPVTPSDILDTTSRVREGADVVGGAGLLSSMADRVWRRAVTDDLGPARRVATSLGAAAANGHLMVYLRDRTDERAMIGLGLGGEVPPVQGDSVIVVGQPLPGTGPDQDLHRTVTYDVRLDPRSRPAQLTGQLAVTLHNDAPSAPADGDSKADSRTLVSVFSALPVTEAAIDGPAPAGPTKGDLGRETSSAVVEVPRSQARTVHFAVGGGISLDSRGWYRLDFLRQSATEAEEGRITVSVPPGWRIREVSGLSPTDARHAAGHLPEGRDRPMWVRIERSSTGQFWDRLLGRD